MAATLTELVKKGCSIFIVGNLTSKNKEKFAIIGSRFSTLRGFKEAEIDSFNDFKTVEGNKCFNALTTREKNALMALKDSIDPGVSIEENFIIILTKDFIRKQLSAIDGITIKELNANPLLCKALKLKTPIEFVKFYTYSALSRSIVTSMGFLVQDLLLYSNDNVFDGKEYEAEIGTKWDLVIERLNGVRTYIEVKSGPNDMNKSQILHYVEAIDKVLRRGGSAFFGITYGKKTEPSVTTSILETYVKNWKDKTLIGRELWNYISDNADYHNILMNTLESTAEAVMGNISLVEKIEQKILELLDEFEIRYESMEDFYSSLW